MWEPYPSYHNGLFSPLLVLRDFADRRQTNLGLIPLQVSGSTSAGRVICGTDLAECVSVPGDFLRPQGAFPSGFYPLSRGSHPKKGLVPYMPVRWGVHQIPQINLGLTTLQVSGSTSAGRVNCGTDWVHCPAPEAPLTRGMPTGPRAFLANSGRVWATALHLVPPKKGLVPHLSVGWGGQQIPQINIGLKPLQVSGSTSAGRVICGTNLAECVSVPGDFLRPQGAFPSGFYPLRGGGGGNRP